MNQFARDLIAAFQAQESAEAGQAVLSLTGPEGLDGEVLRVLSAWLYADHKWREPREPCPDGGKPTAKAYQWLAAGMVIDHEAIALASGVPRPTVRAAMARLIGSRCIYPDGQVTATARAVLGKAAARAVAIKPTKGAPRKTEAN